MHVFFMIGVCSSTGLHHYRTFDSHAYDFPGDCKYVLAQDCVNQSFTVVVQSSKCDMPSDTCAKLVEIFLGGMVIKLRMNWQVIINNQQMSLPYIAVGLSIEKVSLY